MPGKKGCKLPLEIWDRESNQGMAVSCLKNGKTKLGCLLTHFDFGNELDHNPIPQKKKTKSVSEAALQLTCGRARPLSLKSHQGHLVFVIVPAWSREILSTPSPKDYHQAMKTSSEGDLTTSLGHWSHQPNCSYQAVFPEIQLTSPHPTPTA